MGYTDSISIIKVMENSKEVRISEHFMKFGRKCDFYEVQYRHQSNYFFHFLLSMCRSEANSERQYITLLIHYLF